VLVDQAQKERPSAREGTICAHPKGNAKRITGFDAFIDPPDRSEP
jgi:hypothetical protein